MADLDEIMAGRADLGGDPGQDEQQTQQQAPDPGGQQPEHQEADGEGERNPLQPALDAERGKSRRYKEELAEVGRQYGEVQQKLNYLAGLMQAGYVQPQRQQPAQVQQDPPGWDWENPQQSVAHEISQALRGQVDPIRESLTFNARLTAEAIYQPDVVKAAEDAFNAAAQAGQLDMREYQRIQASPNPFHEAVLWHRRNTALSEIGTDPQAYRERVKAEILAELQGQGHAAQPSSPSAGRPAGAMPTSFAGARSAGPRATPEWTGPRPLSEIMQR